MSMKDRILKLEEKFTPPDYPETIIHIEVVDSRLDPPDPMAPFIGGVIKSGRPGQDGIVLWLEDGETEQDFLNRIDEVTNE